VAAEHDVRRLDVQEALGVLLVDVRPVGERVHEVQAQRREGAGGDREPVGQGLEDTAASA
jgi:hypothetical protein